MVTEEEEEVEVDKEEEEEEEMGGEWTKSRILGEKLWYQWNKWQISIFQS